MKTTISKILTFTLVLNEEEATWLHNLMQNPLYGCTPQTEIPEDKRIRAAFYLATNKDIDNGYIDTCEECGS